MMPDEDAVVAEGTLADLARDMLRESDQSAYAYLSQGWLAAAMRTLRDARRHANLTQSEVAARLGTTQSAIARLEKDHEGRCSLQRYVAYLAACGALPFNLEAVSLDELRDYVLHNPDAPRTSSAYQHWRESTEQVDMVEVIQRRGELDVHFEDAAPQRDRTGAARSSMRELRKTQLTVLRGGLADLSWEGPEAEILAL